MRLLLVGTPDERERLRAEIDHTSFTVAGEFTTMADARSAGIEAEAILICSPAGGRLPAPPLAGAPPPPGRGRAQAPRGRPLETAQRPSARLRARHVDVLAGDADVGAADAAVANQPRRDEPGRVDANRKTEALRGANHRGVDPNHLPARRHERSTGVARIERRVGLDDVVDEAARL